jgi:hypothetical protein
MKNTKYEAPHYLVFFSLLLLPSLVSQGTNGIVTLGKELLRLLTRLETLCKVSLQTGVPVKHIG